MKKQDEKRLFWGIYKEEDWPAKTLDIMWMINQVGMLAGWLLFLNTCSGSRSIYDFVTPKKIQFGISRMISSMMCFP
jgi:hypothetical protein